MVTQEMDQEIQQDIFRQAIDKAKKTVSWEKLTPSQKEKLITRCLQDHYETRSSQET